MCGNGAGDGRGIVCVCSSNSCMGIDRGLARESLYKLLLFLCSLELPDGSGSAFGQAEKVEIRDTDGSRDGGRDLEDGDKELIYLE